MKKFLLFSLCFSVLLSCFSVFVFASDSSLPSDATNTVWVINDNPSSSGTFSWNVTFYSFGSKFDYIYLSPLGYFYFYNYASQSRLLVYTSTNGWVNEAYKTIYIVGGSEVSSSSSISDFASNFATFVRYDDTPNVSEGVTSSIGFSGQVLSFITSTPGILTLVGLSIAFAIIPFAIGKVKELIKGY